MYGVGREKWWRGSSPGAMFFRKQKKHSSLRASIVVPYNANLLMLFQKSWQNRSHLHSSLHSVNKGLVNKGHFHETKCSFHSWKKRASTDSNQVSITYISSLSPSIINIFWLWEVYVTMNYVLMDMFKIITSWDCPNCWSKLSEWHIFKCNLHSWLLWKADLPSTLVKNGCNKSQMMKVVMFKHFQMVAVAAPWADRWISNRTNEQCFNMIQESTRDQHI